MRSKASPLLPGIAMATRLPFSRQALNPVMSHPPLPTRENPASARNPRMHESSAVPPLPPIGSSRLPVNSDSSQSTFPVVLWLNKTLHVCSKRQAGRAGVKVATGTVKSYDWIRGDWLIELDEGTEEVFINRKDWRKTVLSAGKRLSFQMVHRPKGIYALPVRVHHRGGLGSE